MNKLLSQFKLEKEDHKFVILEILFDFAVVALVSLIFSGFIINNKNSPFDQKYFMVCNAALLSIHWYAHIFFKQRYEKRNSFHRIWVFLKIIGLLIMAIGIDLMVFRKNQTIANQDFLRWFSMMIFLIGFIFSRFFVMFEFMLAIINSRKNIHIFKIVLFKSISRGITMILASIHLALILIYKNDIVPITTYCFLPIYLVIEFLGNFINVSDKNLRKAPKVSVIYANERYLKLILLYIASFFVAGTIQFTFYLKSIFDIHMLGSLFAVYIIAFLIWWSFMDKIYKFDIKKGAKWLIFFSFTNIIKTGSLALVGGMLINSHAPDIHHFMIPTIFFAFTTYIFSYWLSNFTFVKGQLDTQINKKINFWFSIDYFIVMLISLSIGITSLFIFFPMYLTYIFLILILLFLNGVGRIQIKNKHKV